MIVRGRHYLNGEIYDFHLGNGIIQAITPPTSMSVELGGDDFWVAPGLIDIQVNGYGGHAYHSVDDVVAVADQIASAGVTGFCPTVTTKAHSVMKTCLQAIAEACEKVERLGERVLTIHLEGPYISPEDGPRGAHLLEYVREPCWEEFVTFQEAARGRIRLVTLAPEMPGALDFIRKAVATGVQIAIGHHDATREQIHAAVVAGAVLSTHLGNGCHAHLPRHANYIWEQLAHDGLMASIIVDGHHLPPSVVKCFVRTKGFTRLILVSDAATVGGLPPGRYGSPESGVEVWADGSIHVPGTPFLAGSGMKVCDGVDNVVRFAGVTFSEAVQMASANPARLLGLQQERGILRLGARADLALFQVVGDHYELAATVAAGMVVYLRPAAA